MKLDFPFRKPSQSIVVFLLSTFLLTACGNDKPKSNTVTSNKIVIKQSFKDKMAYKSTDSYKLLENTCLYCHAIGDTDAKPVAPPMLVVRDVYKQNYPTKEAFVNALVKFTVDPSEDKAIMKGDLAQYGLMEDSGITKDDVEEIAAYLYDFKLN